METGVEIPLSRGLVALVDADDAEEISRFCWYFHAAGYAARDEWQDGERRTIYMHRQIVEPPQDLDVDHINRDTLDNRRANLRAISHKANVRRMRARRTTTGGSRYRGVGWLPANGKWRARIRVDNVETHLGCFTSERDAARAYDAAARVAFGEYAAVNFPEHGDETCALS